MSGKSMFLIFATIAILLWAVWRARLAYAAHPDRSTEALNDATATHSDVLPCDPGVQPSYPSPDTLAEDSSGAPSDQPLFFGGSIPSTQ